MANIFTQSVSYCSRGAWLELHWKIWTHVSKWSSGTKACMCTGWWYSMLLHAAFESTPERRETNHKWSSCEGIHEEHCSFLADSPGSDGKARDLSKKADCGLPRNSQNWAEQQKGDVNKLVLRSQLGRTSERLLLEYFENEMRPLSSAQLLMANCFTRTERRFCFTGRLAGVALEYLNSSDKLKFGEKSSFVCRMMMQYVASCSTWVNTRALENKSQMIPLRRDSRGTLLVPGG